MRIKKKGQVIQHRHVSPPLPSSSQPPGTCSYLADGIDVDSPSRRALERRTQQAPMEGMEEVEEVEVISSPPMEEVEAFETQQEESQEQEPSVTPVRLGGSRFRRKPAPPSSPLEKDSLVSYAGFDSQEDTRSTGFVMPPSLGNYGTSTSAETVTHGRQYLTARTSSGKVISISKKPSWKKHIKQQEQKAASRALKQNYYGVDIHHLLDNIESTSSLPTTMYAPPLLDLSLANMLLMAVWMHLRAKWQKNYGQTNTAQGSLWIYLAMNVSIEISCAG